MLFSAFSFPNIFMTLVSGYLIDKFGVRKIVYIAASISLIGQAIFALSINLKSYPAAVVGRALFGIGGESLELAQSIIIVNWFTGKELSMSIGLSNSICFLGITSNQNLEPIIAEKTSVAFTIWVGFFLCIAFFCTSIFVVKIDKKKDRLLKDSESNETIESEKFKLRDVKKLTINYWLVIINYLATASVVYCFSNITSGYFQIRFGYDEVHAGNIMSAVFGVCALLSPIIGIIVDRIGKRLTMIVVADFVIMSTHILFILTPDGSEPIHPIFYLIFIGLAYSVHSTALWSALPFTIEEKILGTAYGGSYSIVNCGFFIVPLAIGSLQETKTMHGYFWVGIFLIILAFIGICTGLALLILDKKKGGNLNSKCPRAPQSLTFKNINRIAELRHFNSFDNFRIHPHSIRKVIPYSNSFG